MDIGNPRDYQTHLAAADALIRIRAAAPFRYSGRWHVAVMPDGQAVAYRNQSDVLKRWAKHEREAGATLPIAVVN